jgi:hypothetical protein
VRARFGTRGLPSGVHASWRSSLALRGGPSARILAWARSADGFVVGSPAVLSLGGSDPDAGVEDWRHVGWHEIEHGGWNAESRSLSWTLYGGRRGRVELAEPGRLPELFRERVAASIAVERFVPIRGDRGVTVTARRDLAGDGALSWHSSLTRGLTWSGEGVAEEAARALAEMESEYGSTSQGW